MQINGSLYLASAPANGNIRMKVFEVETPGSPVATKDYADPSFPFDFSITVPNDVVCNIQIFDSDLTTDGTLLASFVYDPKFSSVDIKGDLILTVGDDNAPAAGETEFADADLKGFTYTVERRGIGTLIEGTEWDYLDDGGFKLLANGDKFGDGETFILHFFPKITTVTSSSGGGNKFIAGIHAAITADTTLDDGYYNQLIPLNSAINKLTITLSKIADTPANTLYVFDTSMGSQINTTIKTGGTDSIFWNGEDRSAMYLGKNEQLWLMKGTDGWYVLKCPPKEAGRQFFSHRVLTNTYELNGSLLKRDEYPRLFYDYVSKLPAAVIVSEATWNADATTNRGKFTLGDGSTTFRIPDSRGLFTRNADVARGIDTGRTVGSYQADALKAHDHLLAKDGSYTQGTKTMRAQGSIGLDNKYTLQGDSGDADAYHSSETGSTETRPKNEAKIALICI